MTAPHALNALNAPNALLAMAAPAGVRPSPTGARPADAGQSPGTGFSAQLAEATRQARDPQDGPTGLRQTPRHAPEGQTQAASGADPGAADGADAPEEGSARQAGDRAHVARRGALPAGQDDEGAASSELARLLSRVADPETARGAETDRETALGTSTRVPRSGTPEDPSSDAAAGTLVAGLAGASAQAAGSAAAAARPSSPSSAEGSREVAQGLARLEGADGTSGRAARASGPGGGLSARIGHGTAAGAAGASTEDSRNRLGGRLEPASPAATGPAAEAAALAAGQTASAAAAPAAPAPSAVSSASAPSLAPVAGLIGPGSATGAASGPDGLARGASPGETVPHFTLSPALDSPTFAPALGLQLSVLARDGIEQARMQINPQEMGPIGVQLTVVGQQVQVEFVSDQARTRQVLEQSLQQLASALGDAGFTMTGGGVFQQAREGRGGRDGPPDDRLASRTDAAGSPSPGDPPRDGASGLRPRAPRGLVDLYA